MPRGGIGGLKGVAGAVEEQIAAFRALFDQGLPATEAKVIELLETLRGSESSIFTALLKHFKAV